MEYKEVRQCIRKKSNKGVLVGGVKEA